MQNRLHFPLNFVMIFPPCFHTKMWMYIFAPFIHNYKQLRYWVIDNKLRVVRFHRAAIWCKKKLGKLFVSYVKAYSVLRNWTKSVLKTSIEYSQVIGNCCLRMFIKSTCGIHIVLHNLGGGEIAKWLAPTPVKRPSRLKPSSICFYFIERWRSASMLSTCSHRCWRLVQQRLSMRNHVYVIMH